MAGNLLLGGAIGMGVDAGTGAYRSLYPNPVSVTLEPARGKSKSRTKSKSLPSNAVTPLPKPTPPAQPR